MKKIVIFSGTTEGRKLSESLTAEGYAHTVCVATEYGREVMEESPLVNIRTGRMDEDEIRSFLDETGGASGCVVIDATHPYAIEATHNIKGAADGSGHEYIRIRRDSESEPSGDAAFYSDAAECARAMDKVYGNIMLTTGSKELSVFCANVSEETLRRTYVRVLPSVESLKICEECNISAEHVIAMQGPFNRELNEAIIRQYDIRHLVTKDSGAAGGFQEKASAAANAGIRLHVIRRPEEEEEGIGVREAFFRITGKAPTSREKKLCIYLIGMGMGAASCMTGEAVRALSGCDIVFGAKRLIRELNCNKKYPYYLAKDIIPVLETEEAEQAAVVFSGDTGFFSGAKAFSEAVLKWRSDIAVRVIPGVSSISYLAARLCESWDNAILFSLHGRNSERELYALTDKVRYNEKVFVLLSGAGDIRSIAERLDLCGIDADFFIGVNLSCENEEVVRLCLKDAMNFDSDGSVTALIKNTDPLKREVFAARRDSEFFRAEVPMTKECVRHESIIRLRLKEGDVFYDIGGGTGSVAIEAASLSPDISVFTFERKREATRLIRENIERLGTKNVTVVEGDACYTLLDMPKPDCVFIGGSGGRLSEIIDILLLKGRGIRFAVNAVSLETMEEVREIIKKYEAADAEAVMLGVNEVKCVGAHHMVFGNNPVWVFSFEL